MTRYRRVVEDSEHFACRVLSDAVNAKPRFPVTDPRAPTLAVAWYLRQHGLQPVAALRDHREQWNQDVPWQFDSRGGPKCKTYLQVLVKLGECLPLSAGRVPSQEPAAYYKLLLKGIKTEPGLKHKHYAMVHNRALKGADLADIEPLEDAERRDAGDEFFATPVGGPKPPPGRGALGGEVQDVVVAVAEHEAVRGPTFRPRQSKTLEESPPSRGMIFSPTMCAQGQRTRLSTVDTIHL